MSLWEGGPAASALCKTTQFVIFTHWGTTLMMVGTCWNFIQYQSGCRKRILTPFSSSSWTDEDNQYSDSSEAVLWRRNKWLCILERMVSDWAVMAHGDASKFNNWLISDNFHLTKFWRLSENYEPQIVFLKLANISLVTLVSLVQHLCLQNVGFSFSSPVSLVSLASSHSQSCLSFLVLPTDLV